MKKTLLTLFLTVGALASLHAQQLFNDVMNYPTGNITTNKATNIVSATNFVFFPWVRHSGTANDSKEVTYAGNGALAAAGQRYQVNQNNTDDVHRLFDPVSTNGYISGTLYASFIVSLINLPNNPQGSYFAHFQDLTTNVAAEFRGRIFAVTTNITGLSIGQPAPGTYRIGIANNQGDFSGGVGGPTKVVPLDLATNTDYQVVLRYDIDDVLCAVWVNAVSESDTVSFSGNASDSGAVSNALAAFSFRQTTGEAVLDIRNVIVGLSFTDVVTNAAAIPVIARQPSGITNFSGNPGSMEVLASGLGATYQWVQDGNPIGGGTSQTLVIPDLEATNQGNYYCIISNTAGAVNSKTNFVSVNTTPTPPSFTVVPTDTTNTLGTAVTLTASAIGTGPLTYSWSLNSSPISDGGNADGSTFTGTATPVLSIGNIGTNEAGMYTVTVTGGDGATNTSANVTVLPPRTVNISFLRSLEDTNTWLTTDTTSLFSITGIIINFTNLTGGNTSSYYIEDGTAGINLFVTGATATSFRPQIGDQVTAIGQLSSFNSTLELEVFQTNPYETVSILSHGNPLPKPKLYSAIYTNNLPLSEAMEGSLVLMTNVYFIPTSSNKFSGGTMTITNINGQPINFFCSAQNQQTVGQPMPAFAWSVLGVLSQFLNNTANPRNAGYELIFSRISDISTNPPPAVTVSETHSGNNTTLTWTAVPYNYAYSVFSSTLVTGPYTPIASGLIFTNTSGTFTDTNAAGGSMFYRVSSP
jgi:hypothetical protein